MVSTSATLVKQTPIPETPRQAAEHYHELGFSPIPLRIRSKIPTVKWKGYEFNGPDFRKTRNIALLTGVDYNLAVLDFDDVPAFVRFLQANPDVLGKFPITCTGRGFHLLYKPTQVEPSRRFRGGDVLGEGKLVDAPPSIHHTGKGYALIRGSFDDIPEAIDSSDKCDRVSVYINRPIVTGIHF